MKGDSEKSHTGQHPDCHYCKHKKEFFMPREIIEAVNSNKLVVFAGAGISTENSNVFPWRFFDEIKGDLGLSDDDNLAFAEIMEIFVDEFDRKELLQRIKKRFDYTEAFPELYRRAVAFHKELSTIQTVKEIFTTNWDDYFEKECGAIPITTDEDFAFWDLPQRKVLKLHGSVSSYGSIVATTSDYRKRYRELRDGAIGASLKLSLATKTMIFFGYSFSDDDFDKIYSFLKKSMGSVMPKIFIVSPREKDPVKLKKYNAVGINTDGTFFLSKLKELLVEEKRLIPDDNFEMVHLGLLAIDKEHSKLGKEPYILKKNPESLYLASYQDGIIHAFERILATKKDGSYSCPHCVLHLVDSYEKGAEMHKKEKLYHDVAYCEGYKMGLMYLLANKKMRENFPMYYLYGFGPIVEEVEYLELRKNAAVMHKAAYKWAERWIKHNKVASHDTVFQHTPFV